MTAFVFVNYVDTTLAAAVSSTATSLSLSSSANLPVLSPGEIMPLTLNDAATGLVYEIVYVTAISGTTLTVERAQEGTTAQNWSSGDYAFTGPTAGTVAPVAGTHSPVASETLPAANQLVVTPGTLTAAIDLTLNDAAAAGSGATIYGSAADYGVTVQSPVTTGSPYIELPDGSQVYSWTIPAASPSQGIRVDWDGTNWRAQTIGQTVVAPAVADNGSVQLGQVLSVSPQQSSTGVATPAASTSYSVSNTFTAPCAGFVLAIGALAIAGTLAAGASIAYVAYINGVEGSADDNSWPLNPEFAVASVTAGESVTCMFEITTNSTAPAAAITLHIANIFIPNP